MVDARRVVEQIGYNSPTQVEFAEVLIGQDQVGDDAPLSTKRSMEVQHALNEGRSDGLGIAPSA